MNKFQQEQQEINDSVQQLSWGERLLNSLGPLAGGYFLDLMDLVTFGPLGFYLGPLLGGLMGWWLASVYNLGKYGQIALLTVTAVYCLVPATEFVPLATFVLALIRFAKRK